MPIDLRKPQAALLRAERKSVAAARDHEKGKHVSAATVAGIVALAVGAGAQAADALGDDAPAEWAAKLQQIASENAETPAHMLGAIYEVLHAGHAAVQSLAVDAGARLIQMANGTPKGDPPQVIWSMLGLG